MGIQCWKEDSPRGMAISLGRSALDCRNLSNKTQNKQPCIMNNNHQHCSGKVNSYSVQYLLCLTSDAFCLQSHRFHQSPTVSILFLLTRMPKPNPVEDLDVAESCLAVAHRGQIQTQGAWAIIIIGRDDVKCTGSMASTLGQLLKLGTNLGVAICGCVPELKLPILKLREWYIAIAPNLQICLEVFMASIVTFVNQLSYFKYIDLHKMYRQKR